MRLSPAKIEQLAADLLDQLADIDGILFRTDDATLRLAIVAIMTDELQVEERLDAEIHRMLESHKHEIAMQRLNYSDVFKRTKQRLTRERRIVL
jgi:hypothetical protein